MLMAFLWSDKANVQDWISRKIMKGSLPGLVKLSDRDDLRLLLKVQQDKSQAGARATPQRKMGRSRTGIVIKIAAVGLLLFAVQFVVRLFTLEQTARPGEVRKSRRMPMISLAPIIIASFAPLMKRVSSKTKWREFGNGFSTLERPPMTSAIKIPPKASN